MRSPGSSRRPGSGSRWSASPGRNTPPPWPPETSTCIWGKSISPRTSTSPPSSRPGGALNYGGWEDSVISGLLSAFRTAEGELRQSAAASLYRYLCQQAPIAPICFKNGSVLTQYGRLDQLNPTQYNVFYDLSHWTVP